MVHGRPEAARPEEVNAVQVGDVHTPAGTEGHTQGSLNPALSTDSCLLHQTNMQKDKLMLMVF